MAKRMLEDCNTLDECCNAISIGKLLTLHSTEDVEYVKDKKPTTPLEAATILQERLDLHQYKEPQWRWATFLPR